MTSHYDTLVIGAGQAGLAAAWHLQQSNARFLVLDAAAEVGAAWRRRWDSLRLFTPVRYNALPGMSFPGAPYALPVKDEVADYLGSYAARFALPVQLGARVDSLTKGGDLFRVATSAGTFKARSVIVVGAGNSGAQIAAEIAAAGRRTWLSGRDTGAIPRRFLGRDIYDWLWWTVLRPSVDSRIGRRLMGGRMFAGDPLVGFTRRELERPLLTFAGRTVGVAEGHPVLEDGRVLDSVRTVLWCTGFRPDFRWIRLPVFGPDGYPVHRRGVVAGAPGLGFVGLRHQYRVGSSLLGGVGEDAAHVVRQLAAPEPTG